MQSLRKVAIKIGHGSGTLRKHYLIPELEINYIKNGNIIDISERESYEGGGEINVASVKSEIIIKPVLTKEEIELILNRKLNLWDDSFVEINGNKYQRKYLTWNYFLIN